jgi:hypothetical protein
MIRQFNSAPNMELLFVRSQLSQCCQLAESSAEEIKKGEKLKAATSKSKTKNESQRSYTLLIYQQRFGDR